MKFNKHFLKQNIGQAKAECRSANHCLKLVEIHLSNGDIELAKQRMLDGLLSIQELSKLADQKKKIDRQKLMYNGMPTVTHIELTRMINHE